MGWTIGCPTTEGLVETLTQAEGRASPVVVDIVPSLSLLVAGTSAPHPQELLSSKEFPNFSENAQRHYGVVIYDTPAALENADAYVVASRVGSAILLARRNRTKVADCPTSEPSRRRSNASSVRSPERCLGTSNVIPKTASPGPGTIA